MKKIIELFRTYIWGKKDQHNNYASMLAPLNIEIPIDYEIMKVLSPLSRMGYSYLLQPWNDGWLIHLYDQLGESFKETYGGPTLKKAVESAVLSLNSSNDKIAKDRKYTKPVGNQEDDEIYSVEEWIQAVKEGCFGNYDGSGYWVKDGMRCMDEVFRTPPLDATHVIWFSK